MFKQRDSFSNPINHLESTGLFVEKFCNDIIPRIEPPYSIALNGGWGSGKTTLLRLIYNKNKENKYVTVWFNPWEYEYSEDISFALLKAIFQRLRSLKLVNDSALKVFGWAFLYAASTALSKLCKNRIITLKETSDLYDKAEEDMRKSYETFVDEIEVFKGEYIRLVNDALKKAQETKGLQPVLIVILDDMDRCQPDNSLKLIEALKNLFCSRKYDDSDKPDTSGTPDTDKAASDEAANVVFISAFDAAIVKNAIAKHFELGNESVETCRQYFNKIYNMTLNVPAIGEAELMKMLKKYANEILLEFSENDRNSIITHINTTCQRVGHYGVRQLVSLMETLQLLKILSIQCFENLELLIILLFLRGHYPESFDSLRKLPIVNKDSLVDSLKRTGNDYECIISDLSDDSDTDKMISAILNQLWRVM